METREITLTVFAPPGKHWTDRVRWGIPGKIAVTPGMWMLHRGFSEAFPGRSLSYRVEFIKMDGRDMMAGTVTL